MRYPLTATPLSRGPWAHARWLVLAPHPDDETLGAGALIAQAAAHGRLAGLVYVTDGAASHPAAETGARQRLVAARREEGRTALRRLAGARSRPPVCLDWPDAAPPDPGSRAFATACRRLAALCRARKVDALAVTASHEPHGDHAAACALAYAAMAKAGRPLRVFEYLVWAAAPPRSPSHRLRTQTMPIGRRRWALAAHRSQLTPLFGEGFRLPEAQRRMRNLDVLYLRSGRHAARR